MRVSKGVFSGAIGLGILTGVGIKAIADYIITVAGQSTKTTENVVPSEAEVVSLEEIDEEITSDNTESEVGEEISKSSEEKEDEKP